MLFGYLLMVGTGLRIAMRCDRPFEKLLATGLSLILGVQTFVIIGGVTRIIPLTGITLPFVSYGGSSLVANYILLALLLRISHDTVGSAGAASTSAVGDSPLACRHEPADPSRRHRHHRACSCALFAQLNYLQVVPGQQPRPQPPQHPPGRQEVHRPSGGTSSPPTA